MRCSLKKWSGLVSFRIELATSSERGQAQSAPPASGCSPEPDQPTSSADSFHIISCNKIENEMKVPEFGEVPGINTMAVSIIFEHTPFFFKDVPL